MIRFQNFVEATYNLWNAQAVGPPSAQQQVFQTFKTYLNKSHRIYSCNKCGTHLAPYEDLISKQFTANRRNAYLFNSVVNIRVGREHAREFITGGHIVKYAYCKGCKKRLGWQYVWAADAGQKYKEGRYVIESARMMKENPRP